jgi:hypothetical protein
MSGGAGLGEASAFARRPTTPDDHAGVQLGVLPQGAGVGIGPERTRYDDRGLGDLYVDRAGRADEMEESAVLGPLLSLGQRSYEVYLTHMFVVLGVFSLFVAIGQPVSGVPGLFA